MRMVRGVNALVKYLEDNGITISRATIYNRLREGEIPHTRPSPRVLLFDLNKIDEWLRGE